MGRPKLDAPSRPAARDYGFTLALFAVALLARGLFALRFPLAPAWDGVLYERGAQAIARGLGYSTFMFVQRDSDTVATAFYPVGYPAFIGSLYALFGPHLSVLRWAGVLVSAATVAVTHRVAWRFAPGWGSRLAGLALALMPGQILFAGAAMTEPLFGLLLVLAVYALVRREEVTRPRDLAIVGLLIALATFVRPQAVVLAVALPWLRGNSVAAGWRGRIAATVLVTSMVVACVAPWSMRNCMRLDGCAFVSTNGGSNLAIGAVPRANGRYIVLAPGDGCRGVRGEVHRDRCWRGVAIDAIRAHPGHWLKLAFRKLDHTVSYESFPVGYVREAGAITMNDSVERFYRRAITAPWRLLLALALVALLPLRRRNALDPAARASLAACVALLGTHMIFFGGDRYHLPLVPLIAVLAAGAFRGVHAPWSWRGTRTLRHGEHDPPARTSGPAP